MVISRWQYPDGNISICFAQLELLPALPQAPTSIPLRLLLNKSALQFSSFLSFVARGFMDSHPRPEIYCVPHPLLLKSSVHFAYSFLLKSSVTLHTKSYLNLASSSKFASSSECSSNGKRIWAGKLHAILEVTLTCMWKLPIYLHDKYTAIQVVWPRKKS